MKFRSLLVAGALAFAPAALVAPAAFADAAPIYTAKNSNVAVGGHDPVAYFTLGEPTEGSAEFTTIYQGAEFQFVSQENLDTFLAAPETYAPQYGGYCAYAVANGQTAKGNPDNWSIVDGKLYLNLNSGIQRRWNKDQSGYISKANVEWPGLVGQASATVSDGPHVSGHGS